MNRSMGSDKMYMCVLRELADEVSEPLMPIFENYWQFSKVPTDCKKEKHNPKEGEKGRGFKLQVGQSHLSVQQDHGADPPGSCDKVHGEYRGDL